VPGDVDAADQSLVGETRDLRKGRVADDEMRPELLGARRFGLQHTALADLEGDRRIQHRQRRQDPQQNEEP
jgi:hypothetical protein